MKPEFLPYIRIARLISRTFGPDCEVVLHDLSTPQHSVIHVENNVVTGRRIGDSFRHLVQKAIEYDDPDGIFANYYYPWEGKLVRASSLLIRDAEGKTIGALCINIDATAAKAQLEFVRRMLPGFEGTEARAPTQLTPPDDNTPADLAPKEVTANVTELVNGLIDSAVSEAADETPLTKEKRLAIMRFLEARDVFLVKGAIDRVAERLGIAKVTVYSDLDTIRKG